MPVLNDHQLNKKMKSAIRKIVAIFVIIVFAAPQLYKTVHIFMDHHGHLRCEAMKRNNGGLNAESDHCLICDFNLAIYDEPVKVHFPVTRLAIPFTTAIYAGAKSIIRPGFHFLLRAPPQ